MKGGHYSLPSPFPKSATDHKEQGHRKQFHCVDATDNQQMTECQ